MTPVPLNYERRVYRIKPDIQLVCEIEDELGGIPRLLEDFSSNAWRLSDLVTLVHMMLASAGKQTDYVALGNKILEEGAEKYLQAALRLLQDITQPPVPVRFAPAAAAFSG